MSYRRYDMVSVDAQTALTAFVAQFEDALQAQPEPWAVPLGDYREGRLPIKTKWPISLSTAGYQKFNGDPRYRSLADKFIEMVPETWQDGIAELARNVEAPDFYGWGAEPQNMAAAAAALANKIVATLLAAGKTTDCWDGKKFFAASGHPYNMLKTKVGTYGNLGTSKPVGVASLAELKQNFRAMKAANGDSLGLELTHIVSPSALDESWRDVLERDLIIESNGANDFGTVRNRHKGTVKFVVGQELSEAGVYYGIAANKSLRPWALQSGEAEVKILDRDSALYEREKKVGIEGSRDANGVLLFPQCIQRFETT